MMVSVQSTGALERRMEVQVPAERIEAAVIARLRNFSRTASLKGFRPGKAPLKVVRQQFGSEIHREVIGELMQASFAEAVTEQKLNPAAGPRIEPISVGEGQDLKYAAIFEVLPEVKLNGLDQIEIERPVAAVDATDVEAMIENLRQQRPNWKAVTRAAQTGDRVTIDFLGTIGGEPFDGGTGEGVPIILGSGRMLPEFEAGLVGLEAGATKTFPVHFPDGYHSKPLAGKAAEFQVTAKTVEAAEVPPLDDEFCAAFGVAEGGIEALRREVNENMNRELAQNVRARMKAQVLDRLLAANPIEVPSALVETQVRDLQIEAARRIGARDVSQVPPREPFLESARRRVALGLLINEVMKAEKIELDRAQVNARLDEIVSGYDDPAAMLRAYRQNPEALRQVEMLVLEDQVVERLLAQAKVKDQATTFKDLMKFGD